MGRVFLSDIVDIQTDGVEKRKAFVFALHTRKRAVLLQAANSEDRDKWVHAIHSTLESDKEAEHKDPFRKTLRRLARGGCGLSGLLRRQSSWWCLSRSSWWCLSSNGSWC